MPQLSLLSTSLLFLATLPSFATPSLAQTSIRAFPQTSHQRAETALCFVHTADGQSFDLTKLCGRSAPTDGQDNRRTQSATNNPSPNASSDSGDRTGAIDSPSPNNPNSPQCYIVDSDGSPCS